MTTERKKQGLGSMRHMFLASALSVPTHPTTAFYVCCFGTHLCILYLVKLKLWSPSPFMFEGLSKRMIMLEN